MCTLDSYIKISLYATLRKLLVLKSITTAGVKHNSASCTLHVESPKLLSMWNFINETPGNGKAKELLQSICSIADLFKVDISIVASPIPYKKGLTYEKLISFYESFGFEFYNFSVSPEGRKFGHAIRKFKDEKTETVSYKVVQS